MVSHGKAGGFSRGRLKAARKTWPQHLSYPTGGYLDPTEAVLTRDPARSEFPTTSRPQGQPAGGSENEEAQIVKTGLGLAP